MVIWLFVQGGCLPTGSEGTTPRMDLFGIPAPLLFGQLLLGLINGAFYAMLSLGLAVIFGLLNIVNMAHGAQFMMGAFAAWMLLTWGGIGYWWALLLAPLIVAVTGVILENWPPPRAGPCDPPRRRPRRPPLRRPTRRPRPWRPDPGAVDRKSVV